MSKRFCLFALLLMASFGFSLAQDFGFQKGYIITPSNSAIPGYVKYANAFPSHMLSKIRFKETEDGKTKSYAPDELLGFGLKDNPDAQDQIFHAVAIDPTNKQFMRLIVDGYIKMYEFMYSQMGTYGSVPQYASEFYLKKKDDKALFFVAGLNYKKKLSEYLSDNFAVVNRINSGDFKRDDIPALIVQYNLQKNKPVKKPEPAQF